jgi:DNA-binding PadR family transcriptional regulator
MVHRASQKYRRLNMADKKPSPTRYVLLGLISQEPRTGYGIKTHLDQPWLDFWNESYGQIYPHLKALLRDGCVTMEIDDSGEGGGAAKKIYTITEEGEEELAKWMRGADRPTQIIRDEQKIRLLLGGEASPFMARALIERMIDETRAKQEAMLELELESRNTFEQLLYDYALEANNHKLEWLAHALETISEQFSV